MNTNIPDEYMCFEDGCNKLIRSQSGYYCEEHKVVDMPVVPKPDEPTTEQIQERHDALPPAYRNQAHFDRAILLSRLKSAQAIAESHSKTIADMDGELVVMRGRLSAALGRNSDAEALIQKIGELQRWYQGDDFNGHKDNPLPGGDWIKYSELQALIKES